MQLSGRIGSILATIVAGSLFRAKHRMGLVIDDWFIELISSALWYVILHQIRFLSSGWHILAVVHHDTDDAISFGTCS